MRRRRPKALAMMLADSQEGKEGYATGAQTTPDPKDAWTYVHAGPFS